MSNSAVEITARLRATSGTPRRGDAEAQLLALSAATITMCVTFDL